MDLKLKPVYEDFEVHTEWVHETADDNLIAYLPGFTKEQLKVQVTSGGNLRLSGERPSGDNKFSRFSKEVPIPSNCDQNKIRANYKVGMLHVKFPKQIVLVEGKPEKAKPSAEDPIPKSDPRAADVAEKQNNGVEQRTRKAMDLKLKPVYEDFEVHTEWVHETEDDNLIAYLPGFRKDQLKVQVTSAGNLRLSGERPIGDNKFGRFSKEVPIPSNCDQNKIRANYKGGMLHVKFPKQIVPVEGKLEKAKPSAEDPIPKSDPRAADVAEKQNNGVEQGTRKGPHRGKVSEQTPEPGQHKENEDNNKGTASNEPDPRLLEKDKNGSKQEEKSSSMSGNSADST